MNSGAPRVEDNPSEQDLAYLEAQINAHNVRAAGADDYRALATFVRDGEGEMMAGLSGYTWAGFCEIRFLWVHETQRGRGLGTQLLLAAEREAAARGCRGVTLNSYTFQAPGFYRRHGYAEVGRAEDCPPGQANVFFTKRFAP